MNKIRWRMLLAICLLLNLIPLTTSGQIWASVPQQVTSAVNQMQAVQAAVSLLLDDADAQTDSELGYVAVGISSANSFSQAQKWQNHFCATYEICAVGDANGDGKADIIKFVRTNNGPGDSDVYVARSSGAGFDAPQKWQDYFCTLEEICEVGDVNGDGKADIITFVRTSGRGNDDDVYVALSDGTKFGEAQKWQDYFCTLEEICEVGDVNGDGKADIITFVRTSGRGNDDDVYISLSDGTKFGPAQKWQDYFCTLEEICKVGDVNGDGKADIITFVRTSGRGNDDDVYIALSDGTKFGSAQKWQDYFCTLDEVCAVGDVNGDGKADLIVFERSDNFGDQGVVRVALSSGSAFVANEPYKNVAAKAFCVLNDFCAIGDVTGDGKADIVNFSRFNWPETTDENLGGVVPGVTNNVFIAAFKDRFYRFSTKDLDHTVFQSSSTDGRIWSDYQVMPNVKSIWTTTSSPSSFCVLGHNTSNQPFASCINDPAVGWSNPSTVTNFDFALFHTTYFQGRFYAVGYTQAHQIAISSSTDAVQWTPSRLINTVATTRNSPIIAGSNDKLCVAWLTNDFIGHIAISCTDKPDADWPSGILVPGSTKLIDTSIGATFGFTYIAGRFTLAWGAEADECRIAGCKMPTSMMQSIDGSNWSSVVKYNVIGASMFYDVSQIEHTDQRVCMLTLTGITDGARYAISCRPIPLTTLPPSSLTELYLPMVRR